MTISTGSANGQLARMTDAHPCGRPPGRIPIANDRGEAIVTPADWRRLAPPAAPHHWREYRSAYELAHAWTRGDGAERLAAMLGMREGLAGIQLERGIAERRSWFDDIPGKPRHHDLLVLARTNPGLVVVGIEAKADEPFDRELLELTAAARRRFHATRAPQRVDRLTRAFFGTTLDEEPALGALRYQLLSALAGTLVEAGRRRATVAVLAVHEFITPETAAIKRQRNARDLDAFVARLGSAPRIAGPDGAWIAGPFAVRGNAHLPADVPVYIGHIVSRVERRAPSAARPPRTSGVGSRGSAEASLAPLGAEPLAAGGGPSPEDGR